MPPKRSASPPPKAASPKARDFSTLLNNAFSYLVRAHCPLRRLRARVVFACTL
jgi:hypothetical protein